MAQGPDRVDGDAIRSMVDAVGEPGQRRFRFVALVGDETVVVWMEKQQLQALGIAIEQVLDQIAVDLVGLSPNVSIASFDFATRIQFRAGRMELGYDERRDRVIVIAHDLESMGSDPRVVCRISRDQARDISADASSIVSAGRPLCPLCGEAMGPGPHVCPGMNGHLPVHFDEEDMQQTI